MQYVKAIYYRKHDDKRVLVDVHNKLLEELIKSGVEEEWFNDRGHSRLMNFNISELGKVNTDDVELVELIDDIQNDELPRCDYCQAITEPSTRKPLPCTGGDESYR